MKIRVTNDHSGRNDSGLSDLRSCLALQCLWPCFFSKVGYINYMKSCERCEQDIFPLWWDDTTCIICRKVSKSLSSLKRCLVIHKNFVQVQHQVTSTVIASFVCLQVCKTAENHLRAYSWRESVSPDNARESRDGNHLWYVIKKDNLSRFCFIANIK